MAWFGNELVGVWVGAILTLIVYSYLLGDNPLYRLAEHIFVGATIAYVVVCAYHQILRPQLIEPLVYAPAANLLLLVPLVLSLLLLLRALPPQYDWCRKISGWGNLSLAYLVGVGAALAVGGAVLGTLIPQARAAMVSVSPHQNIGAFIDNLILVVGTLSVLLYFRFNTATPAASRDRDAVTAVRRGTRFLRYGAWLGRIMLMITFGALFAGVVTSRVTLLIARVRFLLGVIGR